MYSHRCRFARSGGGCNRRGSTGTRLPVEELEPCRQNAYAEVEHHGVQQVPAEMGAHWEVRNTQSSMAAATFPWTGEHRLRPELAELLDAHGDRFPAVQTAVPTANSSDEDEHGREFGLRCVLDGIAAAIARRSPDN